MSFPPTPPPPPPGTPGPTTGAVLRPLSVGEILDRAFKIYWRNFGTLARIVLVVVVPAQVLSVIIALTTTPPGFTPGVGATELDQVQVGQIAIYAAGQILVALVGLVVYVLSTGGSFRAVSQAYLGGRPDWRQSLRFAADRARRLIWLSLLLAVFLLFAFIALFVPGVWLGISWLVAIPALLLEDARGINALSRSFRLVRGHWWPTFGCMLVVILVLLVVGAVVGSPVIAAAFLSPESLTATTLTSAVASTLSSVVSTPLAAAVITLIYFDLRVRKEGLDLEQLAQLVGTPPPAPDAPALAPPAPYAPYAPPTAGPGAPPPAPPPGGPAAPS